MRAVFYYPVKTRQLEVLGRMNFFFLSSLKKKKKKTPRTYSSVLVGDRKWVQNKGW